MTYEQLTIVEESPVGYYGMKWLDFMEEHHPKQFQKMEKNKTLHAVARSVNQNACEYKKLLNRQYEEIHPRPYEWEDESEHRSWTFTRNFYTDHDVMVEQVLILRTKP